MLSLRLQPGVEIKGRPGAMVAMDASVKIKGKVSFHVSLETSISNSFFLAEVQLQEDAHWRRGKIVILLMV